MTERVNTCGKRHCGLSLVTAPAAPTFSSHHPDRSAATSMEENAPPAKRLQLVEGSDDGQHVLAITYFKVKVCTLF